MATITTTSEDELMAETPEYEYYSDDNEDAVGGRRSSDTADD